MVTDGRFSGGTRGFMVGHVAPEAFVGGPIALVKNGDKISINLEDNSLNLHVSEEELATRKEQWRRPDTKLYYRGTCKICITCRICSKWCNYKTCTILIIQNVFRITLHFLNQVFLQ